MKNLLITIALKLAACSALWAQDCGNFLYMTNNAQVQLTIYDKKGKEAATQTWKVTDVKKEGGGFTSQLTSTMKDDKGKEIATSQGSYKCTGGNLQADIRMSMPQQPQGLGPSEAQMTSMYLEYPSSMSVGQSLKDVDFNMDITLSSGIPAKISYKAENRKVDAKEKVTTPAGSWEAFIITYDGYMRIGTVIGIPMSFKAKEWFVPGMGVVKTESYAKNGKLNGSTMITSITK
ncbi:hypothetical protein V9K67_07535 [Paraflavisolibacter sp. H34]|uniref:TapB family protein n=1 Tax=Huijunlia imazamoxiresistens TaxID=3127457 RepID=UPI0030165A31